MEDIGYFDGPLTKKPFLVTDMAIGKAAIPDATMAADVTRLWMREGCNVYHVAGWTWWGFDFPGMPENEWWLWRNPALNRSFAPVNVPDPCIV